jgi:cyclophilin family peptidyl-prolyl cis-trans isomerase
MGDIHVRLYPEECPKTVENFTTHCRNGYYDNLIFHRVIKGFMIQTGDPLGDGTGGQSIWGSEFEDEFHKRYFSCILLPYRHKLVVIQHLNGLYSPPGFISSLTMKLQCSTLVCDTCTHLFLLPW